MAGGCSSSAGFTPQASSPGATSPTVTAPAATSPVGTAARVAPTTATPAGSVVFIHGTGWAPGGIGGPVPPAGQCNYQQAADGYYLPDPACTPGAVNASATAAMICTARYSSSVRPPVSLTEALKYRMEAAYRDPAPTSGTELDHLVPLGLGGASDARNLWAQPDQGSPAQFDPQDPFGANAKDGVEDRLHDAVCHGQVDLRAAQLAIAADWTTAESRLGVSP